MNISVIIPTLNEAENISDLVLFIKTHGKSSVCEVIVVDANSTDNTGELAAVNGATVIHSAMTCRAKQMNQGARIAIGDVFYFIHADVRLVESFATDIEQAISGGSEAGCYQYAFNSPRILLKINSYFTRFNKLICRGGDQTLFVTKKLFSQLNGFDEYYTIMEDYDMIRRIQKVSTFKVIPRKILVSARKYATNSWLRVQLANLVAFTMFRLRQKPARIRVAYKRMLNYR